MRTNNLPAASVKRAFVSDTEEAQAKLHYPVFTANASLESKIRQLIRANSGDEKFFPDLEGSNLGTQAYTLTGKDAQRLVEFAVSQNAKLKMPKYDPSNTVVVGVVVTFDEPELYTMVLDKKTLRPVFVEQSYPANVMAVKELPKSLQKDDRFVEDGGVDMFKLTAALLESGKTVEVNKGDRWHVAEWLTE